MQFFLEPRGHQNGVVHRLSLIHISVESAGGLPTPREAVFGVLELLDQLIPEGDARLYLLEWQQSETATFLTFGYQSGGVPIRFAEENSDTF